MHPLLRMALLTAPREFRERFGAQIVADAQDCSSAALPAFCANLFWTGMSLRAESLWRDVTFAVRGLLKSPLYTVVVIATIAFAIGANVAVASVLNAVLLRPLPYPDSQQLAFLAEGSTPSDDLSYANARDLVAASKIVASIGLLRPQAATLTGRGTPVLLQGGLVNATYFATLGEHAELGRLLDRRDIHDPSAVVISDALWRTTLAGDLHAIGKSVILDGRAMRIIGVAPPGFRDPTPGGLVADQYWTPMLFDQPPSSFYFGLVVARHWHAFHAIARIVPGASMDALQADARRTFLTLSGRFRNSFLGVSGFSVWPMMHAIVGPTSILLWMLYAAVAIVLVIACVNVANLMLVRMAGRERELVMRTALGASRGRLVAQLTTEIAVLALFGGAVGLLLAVQSLHVLQDRFAQLLPRWEGLSVDGTMLLYAVGLVGVTIVLSGLFPALGSRPDLNGALKAGAHASDRAVTRRFRSALVMIEIALAVAVMISAGLVLRSFVLLTRTDVGFDGAGVSVMTVAIPSNRFGAHSAFSMSDFANHAAQALNAVPGVSSASAAGLVPFFGDEYPRQFTIPGRPDPHAQVETNPVGTQYFTVMRIPLVTGRAFDARDTARSLPVVIVSASFAQRYFGTSGVLGRQIQLVPFAPPTLPPMRIVGVVGDVRASYASLPEPEIYEPVTQLPSVWHFIVRTDRAVDLRPPMTAVFASLIPDMAPPQLLTMRDLFTRAAIHTQAATLLFGVLAAIALLLSLAGIYAVTAYSVERRTHEFGVRRAIGAHATDVMRNVLGAVLAQAAAGIAIGIALAALCTRAIAGLLFQTSPVDPLTFGAVVALLIGCAMCAAIVPAMRAVRVHPAIALRYE